MADAGINIGFPTGQTTTQLYNWATSTCVQLNQVLKKVGGGTVDLTALQADVTALQTQVTDIQAQIDDLEANGDLTPQQAFELSLVTRADEIFGSITGLMEQQKTQMQQNADAVMQAAIQAAKANTGVRTTVRVMNEQNIALAERIDTVEADLGVTNSNVTDLTQAVADGDSALATQISSVSSTVAGNTAAITQNTQSINGVRAQYSINVNIQGEQVGWFKMDGSAQGVGALFNVDFFAVGKAGVAGGAPIYPFYIGIANGVASTVLRGEVINDGSISTPKLAAGSVTAEKIQVNSLGAIKAVLGYVQTGFIDDPNHVFYKDLTNGVDGRYDGTFTIDAKNKVIDITF